MWFLEQLRGYGPDKNGNDWKPDLHAWGLLHPKGMKTWIRRAEEVCQLNHARWTEWREWHFNTVQEMIDQGLQVQMPWPELPPEQQEKEEACLRCGQTFPCKAAWSVHAFKVHGRMNRARGLVGGSRCEACEKEFHTSTKLQHHLCNSKRCYDQLLLAGQTFDIVLPGKNNTREQKVSDFALPPMRSEGPRIQALDHGLRAAGMDIDDELAEAITDRLLGLDEDTSLEGCVEAIKQALQTSCNCFSEVRRTLTFLRDTFDREEMDPGWRVPKGRLGVALELAVRRCALRWFFEAEQLHQDPSDQAIRDSAAKFAACRREAANWCIDEEVCSELPRFGAKFLVFIHLFSGERRRGDIQDFLEKLTVPGGYILHILSVDVIFDDKAGDLASVRNQRMWLVCTGRSHSGGV